jgi:hypothetical protein
MKDKKYLDKVIGYLVRGTKIDYDKGRIDTLFTVFYHSDFLSPSSSLPHFFSSFPKYCKNTFGLTKEEMEYVWNEYRKNILDKIKDGK